MLASGATVANVKVVLLALLALVTLAETPAPLVTPPKILHKPEPQYTDEARAARIQGTVQVKGVVEENGRLTGIAVVKSLGYRLDAKAIDCAKEWRFEPAKRYGEPIAVRIVATSASDLPARL